jgi:aspartate/methionine/tyrosine aminotransferase
MKEPALLPLKIRTDKDGVLIYNPNNKKTAYYTHEQIQQIKEVCDER